MIDIFPILHKSIKELKGQPDFIITEYYEIERNKTGYTRGAFLHLIQQEIERIKESTKRRLDKGLSHLLYVSYDWEVDQETLNQLDEHLEKLRKHWFANGVEKMNARDHLIMEHKKNKGRLTNEQIEGIWKIRGGETVNGKKPGLKYLQNLYGEIWMDIK
jgi:hypothetical protein